MTMPTSERAGRARGSETKALFVRLPAEHAMRLDRAAVERRLPKQRIVSELLERYLEPGPLPAHNSPDSARRIRVEAIEPEALAVGHHSFRPNMPEVLTCEQAAELLQVEREVVEQLAGAGELPGRKLGGEWRFARAALLEWLGAPARDGAAGTGSDGEEG